MFCIYISLMSSSDAFCSNGLLNCKSEPHAHFVPIKALPAAEGHSKKKEIPFKKCSMCPFVTKQPYGLSNHTKSWHISSSELPICPHCGKGFKRWNCVQAHINTNETRFKFHNEFGNLCGAQFTCMLCGCGRKFFTTTELMKHQKKHKYYKKQSMIDEYYATEFGKKHLLTTLRNIRLRVECEMTNHLFKKEPLATEITNRLINKEPLTIEKTNHLLKEEPLASEMTNCLLKKEPLATTEPMVYRLHDRRSLKATATNEETPSSVPLVQIPKSDSTEEVIYLFSTNSRRVLDAIDLSIEDVVNNEL